MAACPAMPGVELSSRHQLAHRTPKTWPLTANAPPLLAGDGAGILAAMPDTFFGTIMESAGVRLPPVGEYAVGQVFLPQVRATTGPGEGEGLTRVTNRALHLVHAAPCTRRRPSCPAPVPNPPAPTRASSSARLPSA